MTSPEMQGQGPATGHRYEDELEPPPPTFGDGVRYLWERRVRLAKFFAGFLAVGILGTFVLRAGRVQFTEATLYIGFKGITKGEYPNGRKFSIADLLAPNVLAKAVKEMGKEKTFPRADRVGRAIQVLPVIPGDIQARWKMLEKVGGKKEEFFPSSFQVTVVPVGMTPGESAQLLYALVSAYQDEVKYEQLGALKFMGEVSRYKPDELIRLYDYWDLPRIIGENVAVLRGHLGTLSAEAKDFRDPKFKVSFQDLEQDLSIWSSTRLESLRGLVDGDRLVKNRDSMIKRLQAQQQQVDIQIRGVTQELLEATKLLEMVDRPRTTLAGPMSGKDGLPMIDTNALDRLVASDYVGSVVKRVTGLQERKTKLQEARWRFEYDLSLLGKAQDVPLEKLPPTFERDLGIVTSDLARILDTYNKILSSYLDATVTSQVTLRDGPRVVRQGQSTVMLLAVAVFASAVLAVILLVVDQSVRKAIGRKG